jgi:hypothetical protein
MRKFKFKPMLMCTGVQPSAEAFRARALMRAAAKEDAQRIGKLHA